MGWRRRSGNLIALRAEEAREERRQTCAAGLALRRPRPCPTHTMSPASGNPPFYSCATRSDMSNDPVPCALCNCVMVVKNVSDEGFSLFVQDCSWAADSGTPSPTTLWSGGWAWRFLTYGNKSYNWNIYDVEMELGSGLMVSLGGHLQLGQGNSQPWRREGVVERGHYGYSLGLLPMDKAFVFTWKYDLFFHQSQGLCLSLRTERIFQRKKK